MKVTHIFWGLSYGGIETMLVNIANEQAKQGVEVSIIIINDIVAHELLTMTLPQITVIRINRRVGTRNLGFIGKMNKILDLLTPDVIHIHRSEILNFLSLHRTQTSLCVATLHDIPKGTLGFSSHFFSFAQWLFHLNKGNVLGLQRYRHVFAISNTVANMLKENYGVESSVILNGVIVNNILTHTESFNSDYHHIVQVSRLDSDKKGQDLLIEAASVLKKKGIDNFDLTFIGDGKSLDYLQTLVSSKGMNDFVHFMGSKSQEYIAKHLKDYDIFVQPSRYEGFGLTVAEAMAAQLPVVVSSGQGPSEITEGNRYGWVFENGNAYNLFEVLSYVMSHKEEAKTKVLAGRKIVKEKYDVSVTARKYIEEYRKYIQ